MRDRLGFSDLVVRYGGFHALDGVTACLTGQISAVVGPNGAGKTTLLNVVSGMVRPCRGVVRWDGRDITAIPASRRCGLGIARSFQHPALVPMLTVAENLTAGVPRSRARGVLDDVVDMLDLAPWMGHDIAVAPYGVRKLIDLGRALVTGPRLLLCDEPLSGLDAGARDRMCEVLRRIAGTGIAIVVVEHDLPRVAGLAGHLVVLDFGRKAAEGPPAKALGEPAAVAAYGGLAYAMAGTGAGSPAPPEPGRRGTVPC
jgi:ABC-type branched-subunit amino acid transport system ATPase component